MLELGFRTFMFRGPGFSVGATSPVGRCSFLSGGVIGEGWLIARPAGEDGRTNFYRLLLRTGEHGRFEGAQNHLSPSEAIAVAEAYLAGDRRSCKLPGGDWRTSRVSCAMIRGGDFADGLHAGDPNIGSEDFGIHAKSRWYLGCELDT